MEGGIDAGIDVGIDPNGEPWQINGGGDRYSRGATTEDDGDVVKITPLPTAPLAVGGGPSLGEAALTQDDCLEHALSASGGLRGADRAAGVDETSEGIFIDSETKGAYARDIDDHTNDDSKGEKAIAQKIGTDLNGKSPNESPVNGTNDGNAGDIASFCLSCEDRTVLSSMDNIGTEPSSLANKSSVPSCGIPGEELIVEEPVQASRPDSVQRHISEDPLGVNEISGSKKGYCHDDGDDGEFVAIELASPKKPTSDPSPQSAMDHPSHPTSEFSFEELNSDFAASEKAAATAEISQTTQANNDVNQFLPPARRRILRHPILTPLTKLPWDRFVSAAGACDLFFNCRYSMRQVEDEVREEHRKIVNGGDVEEGDGDAQHQDHMGRDEGYVNLSLGNEFGDFHHYDDEDEAGCDADEFAELGLDCCSMLDDEIDDEVEVVANVRLLGKQRQGSANEDDKAADQCKGPANSNKGGGKDSLQISLNPSCGGSLHREKDRPPSPPLNPDSILSEKQKEEISWKKSNPSLDLMFYRTMIND